MEYNTRKYITLKEEFRRTKDDSEERNLLLAEKNKMILEKQDYEIETAILNNYASHSRYFSDELDALFFLKKGRTNVCKMFLHMV